MDVNDGKKTRILIVDDNIQNIQVLGTVLKNSGYIVGYASSGSQALNLLGKDSKYELILLDINMPEMDGYETCIEIRKVPALEEVPIIFLTANKDPESIVKGFESGAQDYITKPFNPKELLVRVNTQLQLKFKSDEIRQMNLLLELKVEERTAELVDANKKLSVMDKAKSDMLILLSHELKTPLNGIMGYAQILSDMINEPEQTEFVELLLDSANKLLDFSQTALLITSLKLQTYKFDFQEHRLFYLVDKSIMVLDSKIKNKGIVIVTNIPDEDLSFLADLELFSIAISNVLDNAIKASPVNGTININTELSNNCIAVKIRDEGAGFSKEALDRLFEFFGADDVMHHYEGFGLGLASVKLIMDIHKGKIEVKNLDKGAEVSIYLPLLSN